MTQSTFDTAPDADPASHPLQNSDRDNWQQGAIAPLHIDALTNRGDGIGHLDGRAVFVPNTVPGDDILVRLVRVKPSHAFGTVRQLVTPSPNRIRPTCIVADKCGGCQWQATDYATQLAAKEQFLLDAITRIGHLDLPPIDPILAAPAEFHYRNKSTYPIAATQAPEAKTTNGESPANPLKVGYYRRGSHRLVNLNQCPVQDERLDLVLRTVKQDLQTTGWTAYNGRRHKGQLRHLGLRIGRRSGETLLTLVATTDTLPDLEPLAHKWLAEIPNLVGVCLNVNSRRTNSIFGPDTYTIAGRSHLTDTFADLTLTIDSTSFFQVYTEQAEALLDYAIAQLNLQGNETLIDAYCGIGTLTLPLARRVKQAIGIEVNRSAVTSARKNAELNQIHNCRFIDGRVEIVLPDLTRTDIVLLDPPRKGCDRHVLDILLQQLPTQIAYMSCNPATLARDLAILVHSGKYELKRLRAADFFPQTPHVEAIAFLHL